MSVIINNHSHHDGNAFSNTKKPLLEVQDLSMHFGGLLAVDGITFNVNEREIFAIIGPNGAGKTTVFNCISGFYKPTMGTIELGGIPIEGKPSYVINQKGLTRTFQNIRLFKKLTVLENLMIAQHNYLDTGFFSGLLGLKSVRHKEKKALENAEKWLDRVGLLAFIYREAGALAYGQQRLLEIIRCMVTGPKILLLDEPAAGLNPQETSALAYLIKELRDQYNLSILLIEHDMSLVMEISENILVMEYGRLLATGAPQDIRENKRVIKAYLGEE